MFKEASIIILNNGYDPLNWLKPRSRNEREDKWTSDFGNGPTTLVFRRDNVSKNGKHAKSGSGLTLNGLWLCSKLLKSFFGEKNSCMLSLGFPDN